MKKIIIISSPDKTFTASKGENSDFPSQEKYNGYSLEGDTLPLKSVECVLMHNNTIFPFLHLLLIYLFKWHKVFCAGNFVPLNCRKNKDAI